MSTDVSEARAASIALWNVGLHLFYTAVRPRRQLWVRLIALMMEAARTSETSVDIYFTLQYIPEDKSEWDSLIAMMMEATITSETSVDNYFTRHYIPEDKSEWD
jgi:hypothetical protein